MRGPLHGLEGIEELDAVRADLPREGYSDAETDEGADGDVGGEFAGCPLEGFAVIAVETVGN